MNDGNASGLADIYCAITCGFISRAYIENKSDKPVKNGVKVRCPTDYVGENPDKSATVRIVLEKPDKSDSSEKGAFQWL
jgi:hypothetical protein